MTITQIVDIPADHRILLELPSSVPPGLKARIEIYIPASSIKGKCDSALPLSAEIDEVRQLLQNEMAQKGTLDIMADSGGGWEAHIREHYAEP